MEQKVTRLFNETCSLIGDKKYSAALSKCNEALSFEPDNEELLFLKTQIYAHLGEKSKAIEESEKLLGENPEMECAVQIILQFDNQMKTLAKNIIAKNESLRKKAISDLSKMNRPSAAFLLSQCIIHDEELYSEAADALYHMGPSTIPFLYQAFLKTVQAPCAVAYSTISYFGDAAIPYLHEILKKGGDEYHINELIKHIEEKNKK